MLASQQQQGLSVLPTSDSDKNQQQASVIWHQHDNSQSIVDVQQQQQATLNSQVPME